MYEAGLRTLNTGGAYDLEATFRKLRRATKGYHEQSLAIPDLYSPSIAASLEEVAKDDLLPIRLMVQAGNMYLIQPQPVPALQFYEEALNQPDLEKAPKLKASILSNIGEIFRQQGKKKEAVVQLKKALLLFGEDIDRRKAMSMLASIAFQDKAFEEALELYKTATLLYTEAKDEEGLCKINAQLGQLYLTKEDWSASKLHYEKARALSDKTQMRGNLWHIYWGLGFIASIEKEYKQAQDYLDKSLKWIQNRQNNLRTDEGKVAFLDSVQKVFDLLIEVSLALEDNEKALSVVEEAKAQSLLDMMNGRKRQRTRIKKSTKRSGASLSLPDESAPPSNMMSQMAIGVHSFSNMAPEPFHLEPIEQEEKRIAPNRNRLVFYVLDEKIYCWIILEDGTIQMHCPTITGSTLQKLIAIFRESLITEGMNRIVIRRHQFKLEKEQIPVLAKQIFQALIAPFQSTIQGLDALVIEPHAFLWTLPFAALMDQNEKYLIEYCPIFYAPSKGALQEIEEEAPYASLNKSKVLVMGNPANMPETDEFEMLPLAGAEKEAKAIYQLFPPEHCRLIKPEEANFNNIKGQALESNIIHLSTHGWANAEKPLDSFVVLNQTDDHDGFLEVEDIMKWRIPADLVVLSACQTALGRVTGEGVISLTRAFLVAGARSVITTQWSIDDESSKLLMVSFYQHLLKTNHKAKALQLAMLELKNSETYKEPGYWAAYTLTGTI